MNFIETGYKGKNDWWMYLLTIILVFIGTQLGGIPLLITAFVKVENDVLAFQKAANESFMNIGIDSNLYLFLMIFTFMVALWVLYLCVKYLHKKQFKWIITSREKVDWKRFFFGFFLWGTVSIVFIGIGILIAPEYYEWNFKPIPFFILLLVSLLFLPFQTSVEELVFRGYLMQGFGILVKNRWFPLLFTSIIFGLLHGMNPEVEKLGYISMVFYIGTGLFFGITTLMDEGTELALGLHAANNIVAAFFVTANWTVFQTDALFVDTSEPSVEFEMFLPVFVLYPLILLVFSKKYGWKNWREKLFGTIKKPTLIEEQTIS